MPISKDHGNMVEERRAAKRYPTTPDRQETILKVSDATFPARIQDESATGYALQVDGQPAVYEGENVWLRHDGGWTACHVMSIVPYPGGCRVGLSRQAEVNTAEFEQLTKKQGAKQKRSHRVRTRQAVPLAIGVALVTTWFIVPVLRTGRFEPLGFLAEREETLPEPPAADHDPPPDASLEYRLRQMGAEAFTTPDVQRLLRLTSSQSRLLADIAERWQRTRDMARRSGADAAAIRKLSSAAMSEAAAVLSDSQRARWEKVLKLAELQPH